MRLCSQPETWDHFLWERTLNLVEKFHLFSSCSLLSLLHVFHGVEVEYTGRLVKVNAQRGAKGDLQDFHRLAFVPGTVAGAAPTQTPGLLVLPEAAWPAGVPPGRTFKRHAEHDPAGKLHLPVASEAQNPFFAQNLLGQTRMRQCFHSAISQRQYTGASGSVTRLEPPCHATTLS